MIMKFLKHKSKPGFPAFISNCSSCYKCGRALRAGLSVTSPSAAQAYALRAFHSYPSREPYKYEHNTNHFILFSQTWQVLSLNLM